MEQNNKVPSVVDNLNKVILEKRKLTKDIVLPNALKAIQNLQHNTKLLEEWLSLDFIGPKTKRILSVTQTLHRDLEAVKIQLEELQNTVNVMFTPE